MSTTFGSGPYSEGASYLGSDGNFYCYQNGCFILPSAEDVDTFGVPGIAGAAGLDFNGDGYAAGDKIILFPGGKVVCIPPKGTDSMVVNADGSVTHIAYDGTVTQVPAAVASTLVVAGSTVTHTGGDGTVAAFDICAIVAANCNSPMLVNADGSVTYTDNAGVVTVIPASTGESVTTMVLNADGSYTYTSENGTVTNIPATVVSQIVETGGVVTHTDGNGTAVTFDICAIVAANCNSPMTVNADGTITYVDNAGTVTTIPASTGETVTTMVINPDGSITYTSEDGTVTVIPPNAGESVTTLVLNADGSYTYTSENGTVTTIPADVVSNLVEDGGVVTHTDGNGTSVTFDICAIVAANCNSPMVVNADGSITYTDNAGTVTAIPASLGESVTTLIMNPDGSYTYTSENGTVTEVPAAVTKEDIVAGFQTISEVPDTAQALVILEDGTCRKGLLPALCPSVGIKKKISSIDPMPATLGSIVTWDITVWNSGCVDLANVVIEDSIAELAEPESGPLATTETYTTQVSYTITEADLGTLLCNEVVATAIDASGTSVISLADSSIFLEADTCDPICWIETIDLSQQIPEDTVLDDGSVRLDVIATTAGGVATPYATITLTDRNDPVTNIGVDNAGPFSGWAAPWNQHPNLQLVPDSFNNGNPLVQGQISIDFDTPICGAFSMIIYDLDSREGGNTIVDAFSLAPDSVEQLDNNLNFVLTEPDPTSFGPTPAEGTDVTYRLNFDSVDCLENLTFNIQKDYGTNERFAFGFDSAEVKFIGCRKDTTNEFFDANGNLLGTPPEGWQEGTACGCNC